jgi:predicted nuclease of predicted toxin-antitoxin system
MRILIDECVDWRLLRDLPGHDVKTVRQMGWIETVNGALLAAAERQFDVLVTTDKNLSFQQNVPRFRIGVVVLRARSARLRHLRELVPILLKTLPNVKSGEVHTLSWRDLA